MSESDKNSRTVMRYDDRGNERPKDGIAVAYDDYAELLEGIKPLLHARAWFEGNPEGALDEIEHRVRLLLAEPVVRSHVATPACSSYSPDEVTDNCIHCGRSQADHAQRSSTRPSAPATVSYYCHQCDKQVFNAEDVAPVSATGPMGVVVPRAQLVKWESWARTRGIELRTLTDTLDSSILSDGLADEMKAALNPADGGTNG